MILTPKSQFWFNLTTPASLFNKILHVPVYINKNPIFIGFYVYRYALGPACTTPGVTCAAYCSKFLMKRPARSLACFS